MAGPNPLGVPSESPPTKGPTSDHERIVMVDVIRGFALLGVILVNCQSMISWDDLQGAVQPGIEWILETLVSGKFYRLFAFLFGLGFALQLTRLEARGIRFVPLYLRRLAILLLFGVIHASLFWPNDILTLFAMFGVLLLLMRNFSDRALLLAVIFCLLAPHLYYFTSTGFKDFREPVTQQVLATQQEQRAAEREIQEAETHRVRAEGSFREVVGWNIRNFVEWRTSMQGQFAILSEEFLMMLLGLWAGRKRLIQRMPESIPFLKRVAWWGLAVGVAGYFLVPVLAHWDLGLKYREIAITTRLIVEDVQKAGLALCYAAVLALLLHRTGWRLKPLAALGRMTLTNYLLLSVIITTLYLDYGVGIYPEIDIVGGLGLAILTFVLLMYFSLAWLKRFRFGPAEWLWRSMTYGEWQSLRRPNEP